jgi:hypothetical protein
LISDCSPCFMPCRISSTVRETGTSCFLYRLGRPLIRVVTFSFNRPGTSSPGAQREYSIGVLRGLSRSNRLPPCLVRRHKCTDRFCHRLPTCPDTGPVPIIRKVKHEILFLQPQEPVASLLLDGFSEGLHVADPFQPIGIKLGECVVADQDVPSPELGFHGRDSCYEGLVV